MIAGLELAHIQGFRMLISKKKGEVSIEEIETIFKKIYASARVQQCKLYTSINDELFLSVLYRKSGAYVHFKIGRDVYDKGEIITPSQRREGKKNPPRRMFLDCNVEEVLSSHYELKERADIQTDLESVLKMSGWL